MSQATIVLNVEGMSCDACVRNVARKLSRVAGVHHADVTLTPGRAVVETDGAPVEARALIDVVEQMGYHATAA